MVMNTLQTCRKRAIYNIGAALSWPDWLTIVVNGVPTTKTLYEWFEEDPAAVVVQNKAQKGPFICKAVYLKFLAKYRGTL
jgi:hypothetical protein